MFRIYFTNVGHREKSVNFEVNADTLEEAENTALIECRKQLLSKNVMLVHVKNLTYEVVAGLTVVGRVFIRSL